ncbi:MAG: hypothetical protein AAFQ07_05995 [Chloroflexota bacterium]
MSGADFVALFEAIIFPIMSLVVGVALLWNPMLLWHTVNVNGMVEKWSGNERDWATIIGRMLGVVALLSAFMMFNNGTIPRYILLALG